MSYKYLVYKDFKRRLRLSRFEQKRLWLKSVRDNLFCNYDVRILAKNRLSKANRNDTRTRVKNRCVLTGNLKVFIANLKCLVCNLKHCILKGHFKGIKKASW